MTIYDNDDVDNEESSQDITCDTQEKENLQQISENIMIFMRGKYALDEIGDGKNELAFCENGNIIFTIRIYKSRYDFLIDDQCISVSDLETLDTVKELILKKKKPNRKPFAKKNAIVSDCGNRCDLCVHYTKTFSEDFLIEIGRRILRVYSKRKKTTKAMEKNWKLKNKFPPCSGCETGGIGNQYDCTQVRCAIRSGVDKCLNCRKYPCELSNVGLRPEIHTKTIYADDVTWAILPYVPKQYGN